MTPDPRFRYTRRDMLRHAALLGGGLAAAPILAACGNSTPSNAGAGSGSGSGSGGSKRVVVADWGGAIQDAEKKNLYEPFTKETGIEVVISGPPSNAKIKAMVDSGNVEWDVVAGGLSNVLSLGRDYFEPLPDKLMSIDGIAKEYVDTHALAYYVFSSNIGWNTKTLGGQQVGSWADFWSGSIPGKRTLAGIEGGSVPELEFALMADGVPVDQLYPLDVDRAFASYAKIKDRVSQWWSSGSQPGQMLVSGQVSAASIWIGRIRTLQDEGAPIGYTYNQGMLMPASWIVPKGARNKDAAFQLIEYSVQPEVQGKLWGSYLEGPTNSKAVEFMDEKWAKGLPTHPDNAKLQFVRDDKWWGEHTDAVLKRFQEFVL
ncbi:ABC transporter substrate-binding protein [Asanoa sp. WMMD1127]|uniref:ABC transporter substrate-binding protein n=1 Tax=Asanoa sp. WMMD1127 TaxID=3016107 RepID=UPI0024164048|nr:ABC transporter substrate-binding protein [Asanoa sp. WMMD1127]MDG4825275.1 ABC transporter substrate-binding protein [Asanoa sp. WMMD1127]